MALTRVSGNRRRIPLGTPFITGNTAIHRTDHLEPEYVAIRDHRHRGRSGHRRFDGGGTECTEWRPLSIDEFRRDMGRYHVCDGKIRIIANYGDSGRDTRVGR